MPMLLKCQGKRQTSGVTLVELLVASVAVALLAAATLMAFLTASRLSSQSNQNAGAAYLLQQTIERHRNEIACDNTAKWFGPNCASVANFTANEPLPPGYTTYRYKVQALDCDNDALSTPECFQVTATVHWDPPR